MSNANFSKNIFICWFQGEKHLTTHPKSILFRENIQKWKLLNPSWTLHLVSDKDLQNACKKISKHTLELYNSFKLMHLKSDLGRYALLYLYGGIYIDIDMFALRSLESSTIINALINKNTHFIGLSTLNLNFIESFCFAGSDKILNNAVMISSVKNPLLLDLILNIKDNNKFGSDYYYIQNTTGPSYINNFFKNIIPKSNNSNISNIYYFPYYIFEPSPPYGLFDIREDTIAIHKMEMSWISKEYKAAIKLYYVCKPFLFFLSLFILYKIISYILKKKQPPKLLTLPSS